SEAPLINVTTRIGELKDHSLILTRLRQAIASQDFSFIVIFPTLHLLQAILHEFLGQGYPGFGGVRLLLFQGFQDEVCQLLGVRRRLPDPLAQELLLTQCFHQLIQEEKLPYLGRVPFTHHYRQAILEGITEWNRSGLTPEIFETWADGKGARLREGARLGKGDRLHELALLYRTYQKLLVDKGFTSDDLILSGLKSLPAPERKQGPVIVYGFTDLTPIQFKYLEILDAWFDLELIVDPTPAPVFQEWVSRGLSILPSPTCALSPVDDETSQLDPSNTLAYLQRRLWVEPFKSWTTPERATPLEDSRLSARESVRLIQTAGAVRAATAIAREIVDLITAHPDYQWDDFLIITPELNSFTRAARPVFHEYGLPFPEAPVRLREIPCISHWCQATTAVCGNWPWPEMEILIRQSYRGSQAALGDRVLLEISQKFGALSGRKRWLEITKSDGFQRYFKEIGLDIEPLLLRVNWLARIPDAAQLQDYLNLALEWLRDFGVSKSEWAPERVLDTDESLRERMADSRGASFFRTAILEFSYFTADLSRFRGILPLAEFGQIMLDYLLTQEVAAPETLASEKESGLRVILPQEARGLTARVVFITGLEQGVFPGIYINDWKINGQERRELTNRGIRMETVEQFQVQEKLAFYWGLQAPAERLYLVARDQDDNAQPLNRSVFLEEVLKLLPELAKSAAPSSLAPTLPESFEACRSMAEIRQYWSYYLTTSSLEATVSKEAAASGWLTGGERETHRLFLEDINYRGLAFQVEQWRARMAGPTAPFFTQPGSWKLLARIYHPEYAFAITALEDFRKCPYQFYFRHLLKVRSLLKSQLFPSALDLGDLYHQILQEFGDNYREQSLIPENQPEYQKYLDECFHSFFREWLENAPNDPVK
ncbi:MAG TPA: PD-(D/E)XK nuclease family protein, partial [Bacillota bacterium]|nr:PD-(D/E)XK nuclease family protein [Bacillota bacterium]